MSKSIAKGAFYAVATILILWTASLTYSFVGAVLPNVHWIVPIFALVVFDAGMLAWLRVYVDHAEGSAQRAIALTTCLFDFAGVGLMALAELFLGGQTLVTPPANLGEYALWSLALWTVANVGAVLAFHLLSPSTRQKTAIQAEKDAVFSAALERLTTKRTAVSGELADTLAETMLGQLVAELTAGDRPTTAPHAPLPRPQASANGQAVKMQASAGDVDFLSGNPNGR